ncbi:MAG: hypothetical protein RLQ25_06610 [Alphaproteobacteria bacterium]
MSRASNAAVLTRAPDGHLYRIENGEADRIETSVSQAVSSVGRVVRPSDDSQRHAANFIGTTPDDSQRHAANFIGTGEDMDRRSTANFISAAQG